MDKLKQKNTFRVRKTFIKHIRVDARSTSKLLIKENLTHFFMHVIGLTSMVFATAECFREIRVS